mmetsp:Transcript_23262/g.56128  ORF Transcript_23262/g.56128 Transcript_23262/m.56128 type:complete len:759 (+) Transcript_23262:270-2546(+)
MNLLRRTSQKQYDGPATSAINYQSNADVVDEWAVGRSRERRSSSERNYPDGAAGRSLERRQRRRHTASDNRRGGRRRSSAGGEGRLASGVSSRNRGTSQHVRGHHLPGGQRVVTPSAELGIPKSISVGSNSGDTGGWQQQEQSAAAVAAPTGRERRPQMPMEHDGGVLCLCALPPLPDHGGDGKVMGDHNNLRAGGGGAGGSAGRTHRFLSGGTDGMIKLWTVHEPRDCDDDAKLIPRLVRTYAGHAGYVHCIAVLGTLEFEEDEEGLDRNRRRGVGYIARRISLDNLNLSGEDRGEAAAGRQDRRGFSDALQKLGVPSMRRPGVASLDGSRASRGHARKKRLIFVSASRDNTLRIWPVDDGAADPDASLLEDESERSRESSHHDDPFLAKGMKLRGHKFGKDNIGGGLCVCAVPSLSSDEELDVDADAGGTPTTSAGQFCSGGSDGCIRVYDVRSALSLKKPKSGMYATVQLQCIRPPETDRRATASAAPITSLACTHERENVSLFAGDASGDIRRYSRQNECGAGHINGAIWWGCTAIFSGHRRPVTSVAVLSSSSLMPLLRPNHVDDSDDNSDDNSENEVGTMLVSSCEDGCIRVWDAFDARMTSAKQMGLDSSEDSWHVDLAVPESGRIPRRGAMWEIELNGDDGGDKPPSATGVTSLTTLRAGTSVAAGTTDGGIRMWNVSSGLYEGAYNLGRSVQIWSLGVLWEREGGGSDGEDDDDYRDSEYCDDRVGIIVSGDNRGRIRILRKISSRDKK